MTDITSLKQSTIFKGASEQHLLSLLKMGYFLELSKGQTFFQNHKDIKEHYILLTGKLAVLQTHKETKNEYPLRILLPEEAQGEVFWAGEVFHRCNIIALKHSKIFCISQQNWNQLIAPEGDQSSSFYSMMRKINNSLIIQHKQLYNEKLDEFENEMEYIRHIHEKESSHLRALNKHSIFVFYIIFLICAYSISAQWLSYLIGIFPSSSFVTIPLSIIGTVMAVKAAYNQGYTLKDIGLSVNHWLKSLREGFLFTIPILALMTIVKFIIISAIPRYHHISLITAVPIAYSSGETLFTYVMVGIGYIFVVGGAQELFFRGIIQNGLQMVLHHKHKILFSIIGSNLIFSTFHLQFSPLFSLAVFLPGVYLGWLFYRTKTIVASWVAHSMIGFWAYYGLNFGELLSR